MRVQAARTKRRRVASQALDIVIICRLRRINDDASRFIAGERVGNVAQIELTRNEIDVERGTEVSLFVNAIVFQLISVNLSHLLSQNVAN